MDRDRTGLPRGKRLHFCVLALLLALAWQFVLEVRAGASSFLEWFILPEMVLKFLYQLMLYVKQLFFNSISHVPLKKSLNDCMA